MRAPHDTLTSERLVLRRYTADDLDLLVRLHSDPQVMRFAGGVYDRARTEAMLNERILAYYDQHPGLGIWLTSERATGAPVGMHLLNHIRDDTVIQVGYLLYPEYWGRGYATEMAARLLRYGFEELGLPQISAITDLPHVDSQRVLLKIGLHRDGERRFPAYGDDPLAFFTRDARSWLAERPA
jgi:RimJ/RimL family protein N-acetyltransferase